MDTSIPNLAYKKGARVVLTGIGSTFCRSLAGLSNERTEIEELAGLGQRGPSPPDMLVVCVEQLPFSIFVGDAVTPAPALIARPAPP